MLRDIVAYCKLGLIGTDIADDLRIIGNGGAADIPIIVAVDIVAQAAHIVDDLHVLIIVFVGGIPVVIGLTRNIFLCGLVCLTGHTGIQLSIGCQLLSELLCAADLRSCEDPFLGLTDEVAGALQNAAVHEAAAFAGVRIQQREREQAVYRTVFIIFAHHFQIQTVGHADHILILIIVDMVMSFNGDLRAAAVCVNQILVQNLKTGLVAGMVCIVLIVVGAVVAPMDEVTFFVHIAAHAAQVLNDLVQLQHAAVDHIQIAHTVDGVHCGIAFFHQVDCAQKHHCAVIQDDLVCTLQGVEGLHPGLIWGRLEVLQHDLAIAVDQAEVAVAVDTAVQEIDIRGLLILHAHNGNFYVTDCGGDGCVGRFAVTAVAAAEHRTVDGDLLSVDLQDPHIGCQDLRIVVLCGVDSALLAAAVHIALHITAGDEQLGRTEDCAHVGVIGHALAGDTAAAGEHMAQDLAVADLHIGTAGTGHVGAAVVINRTVAHSAHIAAAVHIALDDTPGAGSCCVFGLGRAGIRDLGSCKCLLRHREAELQIHQNGGIGNDAGRLAFAAAEQIAFDPDLAGICCEHGDRCAGVGHCHHGLIDHAVLTAAVHVAAEAGAGDVQRNGAAHRGVLTTAVEVGGDLAVAADENVHIAIDRCVSAAAEDEGVALAQQLGAAGDGQIHRLDCRSCAIATATELSFDDRIVHSDGHAAVNCAVITAAEQMADSAAAIDIHDDLGDLGCCTAAKQAILDLAAIGNGNAGRPCDLTVVTAAESILYNSSAIHDQGGIAADHTVQAACVDILGNCAAGKGELCIAAHIAGITAAVSSVEGAVGDLHLGASLNIALIAAAEGRFHSRIAGNDQMGAANIRRIARCVDRIAGNSAIDGNIRGSHDLTVAAAAVNILLNAAAGNSHVGIAANRCGLAVATAINILVRLRAGAEAAAGNGHIGVFRNRAIVATAVQLLGNDTVGDLNMGIAVDGAVLAAAEQRSTQLAAGERHIGITIDVAVLTAAVQRSLDLTAGNSHMGITGYCALIAAGVEAVCRIARSHGNIDITVNCTLVTAAEGKRIPGRNINITGRLELFSVNDSRNIDTHITNHICRIDAISRYLAVAAANQIAQHASGNINGNITCGSTDSAGAVNLQDHAGFDIDCRALGCTACTAAIHKADELSCAGIDVHHGCHRAVCADTTAQNSAVRGPVACSHSICVAIDQVHDLAAGDVHGDGRGIGGDIRLLAAAGNRVLDTARSHIDFNGTVQLAIYPASAVNFPASLCSSILNSNLTGSAGRADLAAVSAAAIDTVNRRIVKHIHSNIAQNVAGFIAAAEELVDIPVIIIESHIALNGAAALVAAKDALSVTRRTGNATVAIDFDIALNGAFQTVAAVQNAIVYPIIVIFGLRLVKGNAALGNQDITENFAGVIVSAEGRATNTAAVKGHFHAAHSAAGIVAAEDILHRAAGDRNLGATGHSTAGAVAAEDIADRQTLQVDIGVAIHRAGSHTSAVNVLRRAADQVDIGVAINIAAGIVAAQQISCNRTALNIDGGIAIHIAAGAAAAIHIFDGAAGDMDRRALDMAALVHAVIVVVVRAANGAAPGTAIHIGDGAALDIDSRCAAHIAVLIPQMLVIVVIEGSVAGTTILGAVACAMNNGQGLAFLDAVDGNSGVAADRSPSAAAIDALAGVAVRVDPSAIDNDLCTTANAGGRTVAAAID